MRDAKGIISRSTWIMGVFSGHEDGCLTPDALLENAKSCAGERGIALSALVEDALR
jgi:hypothetical protein